MNSNTRDLLNKHNRLHSHIMFLDIPRLKRPKMSTIFYLNSCGSQGHFNFGLARAHIHSKVS